MEVGHRQQVREARFQPARFSHCLALRTMAIATRVISNPLVAARVALLHMSAQHGGPALLDGLHNAALLGRQRLRPAEVSSVLAEDVGHLDRRP